MLPPHMFYSYEVSIPGSTKEEATDFLNMELEEHAKETFGKFYGCIQFQLEVLDERRRRLERVVELYEQYGDTYFDVFQYNECRMKLGRLDQLVYELNELRLEF